MRSNSSKAMAMEKLKRLYLKAFILLFLPLLFLAIIFYYQKISYFFRPLWDTPPRPFRYITHYYAENLSMAEQCSLHGWKLRAAPRRVFDAVIFSNELDLLEIRWQEFLPLATKFIILESNSTFTGRPKPLLFSRQRERFKFAEAKIVYGFLPGRKLESGEGPFVLEEMQRSAMNKLFVQAGIRKDDLLIMSDVDEIPSSQTVNLLRWCDGMPSVMHLQMNYYLYSFEFFVDKGTWRPTAHVFEAHSTGYRHGRQTDAILADTGWHCSFCFRTLRDFAFKMMAYSHADRVKYDYFLDHARIQRLICKGGDLFDMLPEEYSFRSLISKLGDLSSSYSAINLPSYLLKNSTRFKYLLPGNCIREG